ncbi:thioredoxin domain-containing protein 15 isoform X1 [Drosophila montana]|uniref:thioredoxin domain-containing protein 15 isoform X1 n=1 Tax=Drosophila montana TaxID=40370 RepID=UPI00313B8E84
MHPNVNLLILIFLVGLFAVRAQAELSGLLGILQYFGLNLQSNGTGSVVLGKITRGQCPYSFESYALMQDRHICYPDDEHILHLSELPQQRKPPLMIKCLQPDPSPQAGVVTVPKLLIMQSAKDIVNLLKPIGNATKRHEPGSCVLVHFCTPTSLECARVAAYVNLLPHLFPTLPVAYIDAYEFTRFNAEFGIASLPTLMIFHQGRPLIKYDPPSNENVSVPSFIMRHTNLKYVNPRTLRPYILAWAKEGPLVSVPTVTTDFYLILAWAFILICLANYVRQTLFWKQLVEMVQRNWRESEETQMEMID